MTTQRYTHSNSVALENLYSQVEDYPWDNDIEFQGGLEAILGSTASPEQAQELTLRARCFYYTRKHDLPIDFDAYKHWRQSNHLPPVNGIRTVSQPQSNHPAESATSSDPNAPYPTTFAEIVDLISTGQPIPGIKDIPDTVLAGKETHSTAVKRKKPWEARTGVTFPEDTHVNGLGVEAAREAP
ncbi:MAG: hypothetical protein M1835_005516 [Candelina submexicana]|nr:MAG: hypothetical protein M1835_005516 [Candelina submexicana]